MTVTLPRITVPASRRSAAAPGRHLGDVLGVNSDAVALEQGGEHPLAIDESSIAVDLAHGAGGTVVLENRVRGAAGESLGQRGFGALQEFGPPILAVDIDHCCATV